MEFCRKLFEFTQILRTKSRITQEDAFASALTRAVSSDGKEEEVEAEESGGRGKGRGDEELTTTTQRDFLDL
jgi:hypothetical protein